MNSTFYNKLLLLLMKLRKYMNENLIIALYTPNTYYSMFYSLCLNNNTIIYINKPKCLFILHIDSFNSLNKYKTVSIAALMKTCHQFKLLMNSSLKIESVSIRLDEKPLNVFFGAIKESRWQQTSSNSNTVSKPEIIFDIFPSACS